MNQSKFSEFIKEIRKKDNLTQKEFADKFGVTYQAVSKWENGKNMPDITLLKEIAEYYNISVDEFLNGEISKKKDNKKIIIISIIVVIILAIILFLILRPKDTFTFKTISSDCNSFTLTGSLAYDSNKTSLYISNIIYCGDEFESKYNEVSLTLYEKNGDNLAILDSLKYNYEDYKPIGEYLKDITFNIDGYSKMCKDYSNENLYIEIEAKDINGSNTIHKIPLKVEENCSIK